MEAVVGIDIGSSRIKAGAFGRDGSLLALKSVETPTVSTSKGTDFPVLLMFSAVQDCVGHLVRQGISIRGVGVCAMGEVGTVAHGDTLADLAFPAWHDSRGLDIVESASDAQREQWLQSSGGHFRTVSTAAKLGWLQRHGGVPSGTFLNLASGVVFATTGRAVQDVSLAVTTGAVDPVSGVEVPDAWASAGLEHVAIAPIDSQQPWGETPTSGAPDWHLPGNIPVLVAGHDHPVACVGTGAAPGDVIDSLGTGEPLLATMDPQRAAEVSATIDFANYSIERWPGTPLPLLIAEGMRPGLAMESFLRVTGTRREDLDASLAPNGASVTDADVVALERGTLTVRSGDLGWSALHFYFSHRAERENHAVRAFTGATGATVLTGGGLRSTAWVRHKAAVAEGHEVLVSTALETAARGAAAQAGVAAGWWEAPHQMGGTALVRVEEWLTSASEAAP